MIDYADWASPNVTFIQNKVASQQESNGETATKIAAPSQYFEC